LRFGRSSNAIALTGTSDNANGKRRNLFETRPNTRVLITGGQGFVGSYVAKNLLQKKASVHLLDHKRDDTILKQVFKPEELNVLPRIFADVSNLPELTAAVNQVKPTHIIHLAALQVPGCRQNPVLGGQVNVVGHLNVLHIAHSLKDQVKSVVYASSAAVAGPQEDYSKSIETDTPHQPRTHYGYFKLCNEGNSKIYWQDSGVASVGLRPHTIYGVGREIGITSGPSKAIKAAILGRKFEIPFTGKTSFNYVEDIADIAVNCSLELEASGSAAHVFNIRGEILSAEDFVGLLNEVVPESKNLISIQKGSKTLPLAHDFNQKDLDKFVPYQKYTPLREGIRRTAARFRELHKTGDLHSRDLD